MATAQQIQDYINANLGNPQAIADAMQTYGVSYGDIANAGFSPSSIQSYVQANAPAFAPVPDPYYAPAPAYTPPPPAYSPPPPAYSAPPPSPMPAPAPAPTLTADQQWLQGTGIGTFNDSGQFQFTNPAGLHDTMGSYLVGAGQNKGYTADQMASILGNPALSSDIQSIMGTPQTNIMGEVAATDAKNGYIMPPAPAPATKGTTGTGTGTGPQSAPGGFGSFLSQLGSTMPSSTDYQAILSGGQVNLPTLQQPGTVQQPTAPTLPSAITAPTMNLGTPTLDSYSANPALGGMVDSLTRQATDTFGRQAQAIRSNAGAVGGLGGSRQGVAEGIMGQGVQNSLADQTSKLLYQDYNDASNRNLQKYGLDQNYNLGAANAQNARYATDVSQNLGLGNLAQNQYATNSQFALGQGQLGQSKYATDASYNLGMGQLQNSADANRNSFYLGNRALDYTGLQTGANLYAAGQQADWNALNNAGSLYGSLGGLGGTTTTGGTTGGGWQGALGGALGAGQLATNLGWWG